MLVDYPRRARRPGVALVVGKERPHTDPELAGRRNDLRTPSCTAPSLSGGAAFLTEERAPEPVDADHVNANSMII
jgi:hypothetical protein